VWYQLPHLLLSANIPDGHCYLWPAPLVGLHVVSNLLIAIAYLSIPAALLYFVVKRKSDFSIRLIVLFGLFIIFCGVGHLLDIVTLWYPIYWVSGGVRAATAIVSCYTAMEVAIMLPTFLSLKNPSDLEALNQILSDKVSALTEAENALEASQRIFRGAFKHAPIGMALVSGDGSFLKVNKALAHMVGYSEEALLRTTFRAITHPDDLPADFSLMEELESGKHESLRLKKRYFHQQGHLVDIQISVSLLTDSDNNNIFIAHIQDISEQKRTATLQAEKQVSEASNRAKSEFLAMMSHEIRTPMNALIGMTELLHETTLNEQQEDFVDVISTSGSTLLTLIDDILDFSKIESNKLELELSRLDLYKCLEDVVSLFSNEAEKKGISLRLHTTPDSFPNFFRGDGIRLKQILANLVSNSIKFTKEGNVSISVQITPLPLDPNSDLEQDPLDKPHPKQYEILFAVKDTGIGIPADKIGKLFDPFCQIDASTTRRYGGTGLGLAICKRLVEQMQGKIWIEGGTQSGSTFKFSIQLPVYEQSFARIDNEGQIDFRQKRLLIVDSNPISYRGLAAQVRSWNLALDMTDSAETALAKLFRSERPDLIVINEPLIDMEGVHLISQIQNFPNYQTIPIILIQKRRKRSFKYPNSFSSRVKLLTRPIRISQFYNAIAQLLNIDSDVSTTKTDELIQHVDSQNKPLRILLTEDILLNQKVALTMLSSFGYKADIANNGLEAVEAIQKQSYDLVFMDVQMPEMDGLEATQRIRTNPEITQPYIVAMTAHAMKNDREDCLAAGMSDYISKPISKRDLARALKQCPLVTAKPMPATEPDRQTLNIEQTAEAFTADITGQPKEGQPKEGQPKEDQSKEQEDIQLYEAELNLPKKEQAGPFFEATYTALDLENIPILDTQVLAEVSTEASFVKEVYRSFLDDAPVRINAIKAALENGNATALAQTAHALKSLSSCIGAMALFQICKHMEDAGKASQVERVVPLMLRLKAEYERVQLAVAKHQEQL